MLSLGLLTWAHVPTYLQSENNCFTPGHLDYRLSQVVYIKGTGRPRAPACHLHSETLETSLRGHRRTHP